VEGQHDLLPRAGRTGDGEFLRVDLPGGLREEVIALGHPLAEHAVGLRGARGAQVSPPLVELLRAVVVLREVVGVSRGTERA
jgi:hypothetical protein